jgi:hypothetical protein
MCLFLHWDVDSLGVEFIEFLVDFGIQSFIRWVAGKDFFPFCGLSLGSRDCFFCCAEALTLMQSHWFILSLRCWAFWVLLRLFPVSVCSSVFPTISRNFSLSSTLLDMNITTPSSLCSQFAWTQILAFDSKPVLIFVNEMNLLQESYIWVLFFNPVCYSMSLDWGIEAIYI